MAFDGDLDSQSYGLGNDEIAWIPPGGIAFQTLRVYGRAESANPQGIKYTLQGQVEVSITATDIAAWYDIPGPGTLEKLRWTRQGPSSSALVGGIELDGALLVDEGTQWNSSQVWSETGTVTGTMDNVYKGFDGDLSTFASNFDNSVNEPATYTFNPAITGITSLRVYGQSSQSAVPLVINEEPVSGVPATPAWVDVYGVDTLSSFSVYHLSGVGSSDIAAIEVNGKLLVDAQNIGPFAQLFQTWEEGKLTTLKADVAASVYLVETLRAHAEPFDATESYCEGRIVTALGSLWMATEDCEALRQAPASTYGVGEPIPWVNLGVSAT